MKAQKSVIDQVQLDAALLRQPFEQFVPRRCRSRIHRIHPGIRYIRHGVNSLLTHLN